MTKVSIHTPTQGVTRPFMYCMALQKSFNPHTHAGCDFIDYICIMFECSFNPHTHAGCDLIHLALKMCYTVFQSTHPRRV